MSGRVRCLGRKFRGSSTVELTSMLHRAPAGVFWLLAWKCRAEIALDSEHGAETTISTRGGVHTSRAIFGLPIQVVATVATHLLEVTAYSGSRAHAPIIGGEITIP